MPCTTNSPAGQVKRVNVRREFSYITPAEGERHLTELTGDLLHIADQAEAVDFH